ncbi:MAG: nuclear transport factor 2 family protein [Rhizobacter sp.]
MNSDLSPEAVVQRQLDAYNARDLEAWLATYAPDAQQFEHPAKLVASGHAEMRARTALRFTEPNLHARLVQRSVMGAVVIDHEEVTRSFPEGPGHIGLVCIYEVRNGKIQSGSFVFGEKRLDALPTSNT